MSHVSSAVSEPVPLTSDEPAATPTLTLAPPVESAVFESTIIPRSEVRDLLLYFGMGGVSGTFSASTLGAQLYRLEMYAFHARPCERCGGDKKKLIGGSGFICSSRKARKQTEQQRLLLEAMGIVLPPAAADRMCIKCGGRGWIKPKRMATKERKKELTARPTGSSKEGIAPSITVDASDLATLGTIGKRLEQVRAAHLPCAQAIESWFGTPKDEGGQSIRALWHLCDAGRALLKQNSLGLSPAEFFENQREDQAAHPNAYRRTTFAAADVQAEKLWVRARQLWNSTAPVKKVVLRLDAEPEPVAAE